jgi:hypothetical protein
MCGGYVRRSTKKVIAEWFGRVPPPHLLSHSRGMSIRLFT